MAVSVSKQYMTSLVVILLFISLSSLSPTSTSHSCDPVEEEEEASSFGYVCHSNLQKCHTFAILRAKPPFYSLSDLSRHLGLDADDEYVPKGQLLLIPIECRCNGSIYEASLIKNCVKGDTFRSVSQSLQGLTTCLSIREKNPHISEDKLGDNIKLRLAIRCSCPQEGVSNASFLVTYPVGVRDSVSSLAVRFNTTEDAIVSANNKSGVVPLKPALIPLDHKPEKQGSRKRNPSKKKRSKMKLMIAVSSAIAGVCGLVTLVVFGYLHWKKETQIQTQTQKWISNKDPETRQLSLSIRTTSDKKISFEGSQDGSILDSHNTVGTTTPRKPVLEIYAFEELEKATENFSSSNHIKGSVYFGSLKGKDLAIKQVNADEMKRFDFGLLNDQSHYYNHNVIRVLGTCFREIDQDSYLVFEYARNGSLWDWIQNKLAIKNQFIESCYCFLAWKQRIKICHDVAIALKYMHRINYVHGNIKSRNIFLNEDLRGKVGNFGMSKCVTNELATEENLIESSLSPASDIFAYGIIVMEVLSGQTPDMLLGLQEVETTSLGTQETFVSEWSRLRRLLGDKEKLREVMDSTLGESYSVDSAFEIASIARDCTAEEAESRPSAVEIAERVSRLVDDDEDEEDEAVIDRESTLISESSYKPLVKKSSIID
ncbi:Protein kinase-like domain superfamily [Arabidopsis suecica]|uniref:Protein kinase-like domain superfamily n=1 Tax=Arabidopsis suecica TaxID=45249 RepID=A0A8T2F1M8_ARASU|nr:Protein kinase-like domain superfamily [Arabidopsis suecica]